MPVHFVTNPSPRLGAPSASSAFRRGDDLLLQMPEDFVVASANVFEQLQEFDLLTRGQRVETFQQGRVMRLDGWTVGSFAIEPIRRKMKRLLDVSGKYLADRLLPAQAAGDIAGLAVQDMRQGSLSAPTWKLLVEYALQTISSDSTHMFHSEIAGTGCLHIDDDRGCRSDLRGSAARQDPRVAVRRRGPIPPGRWVLTYI